MKFLLLLAAFLVFPSRGWAVLGEDAGSGIHALSIANTKHSNIPVRIMDHAENANLTVREYVGPDNKVFAVKWKGHGFPNLKTLLGKYHGEYSIATAMPIRRIPRRGLSAVSGNLEILQYGTMSNIHGHVILKNQLPPNVTADELP